MTFYILGLGNPGEKYASTRHNTGRILLDLYLKKLNANEEWKFDKKTNSLKANLKIGNNKALLILPETFMNNSGKAVKPIITSKNKAHNLIVIHDDLDLPLGKFKIVFNRGSGGHKGVESIMRAIKTKEFIRIKIGVSPKTPSGKIKKPKNEKLLDFLISDFKPQELKTIKKISKKIFEALDLILQKNLQTAMSRFNS